MNDIERNPEADLFDEFEFKPLTEGLGFHKKAEQIKNSISDSRLGESLSGRIIPDRPAMMNEPTPTKPIQTPASDSISKLMSNLPPMRAGSLDFTEQAPTPISRTTKQVATELTRATEAVPSAHGFRQTEFQARLEESFSRAFPSNTVRKAKVNSKVTNTNSDTSLTPIAASISSAVVDALTVVGVSILCLVIILTITQVDLFGLLHNAKTDKLTQGNLILLFLSTLQLYMLVARSFVGVTLGEWAFDAQLGTSSEQATPYYPLQVVLRTILATGSMFVLPIVSLISGKDILRPLTGLQLYGRSINDNENI